MQCTLSIIRFSEAALLSVHSLYSCCREAHYLQLTKTHGVDISNSNISISTTTPKLVARSLAYLTSKSHSHLDIFLLQHSISYLRIFKLEFYFMKKCSCRESNSRLLIESTVSSPLEHQDNDSGKCNFLVIIF